MMGDSSKETGKVPIGKNPSSVFTISRLCQDDEKGNVSLVIRRRMKKNKKGKTRFLLPNKSFRHLADIAAGKTEHNFSVVPELQKMIETMHHSSREKQKVMSSQTRELS